MSIQVFCPFFFFFFSFFNNIWNPKTIQKGIPGETKCNLQFYLWLLLWPWKFSLTCKTKKVTWICCRKGDPFQGLRVGSCLTLGNELSEETHMLTKQETLLGRHAGQRAGGYRNLGGLLCHVACSLGFYGDGIIFRVVSGQAFWLRVLSGGVLNCSARRILGGW